MTDYTSEPRETDVPWGGFRAERNEPPAPTTEEWVERIARGSTPVREYEDGRFRAWIDPTGRRDVA